VDDVIAKSGGIHQSQVSTWHSDFV